MGNLASSLPPPTPLRQGLRIDYQWGAQKFEIVATAASIVTALCEVSGLFTTWLHCKATQTMSIQPDGTGSAMNVLIPARYITYAAPGPTFRITEAKANRQLGVFPSNQPPPPNPVPLAELERVIASLSAVEIN